MYARYAEGCSIKRIDTDCPGGGSVRRGTVVILLAADVYCQLLVFFLQSRECVRRSLMPTQLTS